MNTPVVVSAGFVVVIATIIVLVAGRRDSDGERLRTVTRYVDSVALLSTFVVLFAGYAIVSELSRFVINSRNRYGSSTIEADPQMSRELLDLRLAHDGTVLTPDLEDLDPTHGYPGPAPRGFRRIR